MTSEAMESEFDLVAHWTEDAVRALGPEYAVPAGCRGSGSPSGLTWLMQQLAVTADSRVLDAGSGVGGPAGWVQEQLGARPVCAEPMPAAVRASRRVFGLPSVVAWSQALPFADHSFDVALCLGVLCTTEEKAQVVQELHRVLEPGGRLGLLVFVQVAPLTAPAPEGNSFPTEDELGTLLQNAHFVVHDRVWAADLPATPEQWRERADAVEQLMAQRHGDDPRWQQAQEQSGRMGALLAGGGLKALLLTCSRP